MIVAGVMSGTSADGIDVALVRISGLSRTLRLKLIAHEHFAYPARVRQAVLASMNASQARVADLSRLSFLLGELYAKAVQSTLRKHRMRRLDLIGCHGQTLYHQSIPNKYLGSPIAATWQTGEASVIAARLRTAVVADFRPADLAAGGNGAPLVPLLDVALFAHPRKLRVLQNLGGIGNFTVLPPGSHLGNMTRVVATDTGPGNMVIDGCMRALLGREYDRNGSVAAGGQVIASALKKSLAHPFFALPIPKTAGREEFGREFAAHFLKLCCGTQKQDVIATATALTASSIGKSLRQALKKLPSNSPGDSEFIVSGGGAKNATLMRMIAEQVKPLGFRVLTSDAFGMPSQAKEAVAFALLAYQTWNRQPGNVPGATGAARAAILGKVSYP
ncbi:MAG TPA: anhydro-N-acetylmuramic acid kinase [Terriglobales bacterium]|nr:anhydro-N-acetylmuramic acid kinase [Terriglobales bacterium]